jgi:hypothetical protein
MRDELGQGFELGVALKYLKEIRARIDFPKQFKQRSRA